MTLKQRITSMSKRIEQPKGRQLPWAPYIITEDGKVYSLRKWRYLTGNINSCGYQMVWIVPYKDERGKDHKSRWYFIHRLVAEMYCPNGYLDKTEVHHKDGDKSHNHYTNLEWVTHSENIQESYKSGRTMPKGKDHWRYGKSFSKETKEIMSQKKTGASHPKFKGYYLYNGNQYASCKELANAIGTYPEKAYRMYKKGLIEFLPIAA